MITPLKSHYRGQARMIDREARGLDPNQLIREFVHNGAEAGAHNIWLDAYPEDDTGRELLRITDDGCGMTKAQMRRHLTTLYDTGRSEDTNYGMGARVSSLPTNPNGVDFASRAGGGEHLMRLARERGEYGVVNWDLFDGDGAFVETADVVTPDEGQLSRLVGRSRTGTAVILRGDGARNTYTAARAAEIVRYISEHYFEIPGNPEVRVQVPSDRTSPQLRKIVPLGPRLQAIAEHQGAVPFSVGNLSGQFHWWTLPASYAERRGSIQARPPSGVGLLCGGEVFQLARTYMAEFGILYRAVQDRLVLLIEIDGAEMDSGRSSLIMPHNGKNVPWKRLGASFHDVMPQAVRDLIAQNRVTTNQLNATVARLLDEDWMRHIQPTPGIGPSADPKAKLIFGDGHDAPGLDPGAGKRAKRKATPNTPNRQPSTASGKTQRGEERNVVQPPEVLFMPETESGAEMGYLRWVENDNTVQVWLDAPPYQRDVERWMERSGRPREFVEAAVQLAYTWELAAHIIDANGQGRFGIDAGMVDRLKETPTLYGKLLGIVALETNIERCLRMVANAANDDD